MDKEKRKLTIDNDNYINIQGFMRTELDLKGNELLVYAIIYGFTQDKKQVFSGSLQYLSDFTGASKRTIQDTLQSLVCKGLLIKYDETINNVKFVKYKAQRGIEKTAILWQNETNGYSENCYGGIAENSTNNKTNNKELDTYKEKLEKEIESNDLISEDETLIFAKWNSHNIIKHRELNDTILKAIQKALKESSQSEILKAIDNYALIYHDKDYYFKYQWTLEQFLKQKNGYKDFLDDGVKWLNYINNKNINKQNACEPDWLEDYRKNFEDSVEDL